MFGASFKPFFPIPRFIVIGYRLIDAVIRHNYFSNSGPIYLL
uniref:Uncharacterized protein n=1 Tax=Anguilla anguilla TaxID=7936 RepID=A0A0E9PFQ8_ANGAN